MMKRVPIKILRLGEDGIKIVWSSGEEHVLSSRVLRENCPSAPARAERGDTSHDRPLSPSSGSLRIIEHTVDEQLALKQISPVGNYAVRLHWADGHDSGLFTFSLLDELGQKAAE